MARRKSDQPKFGRYKLTRRVGTNNYQASWYDDEAKITRRVSLGTSDAADAERKLAELFLLKEPLRQEDPRSVPVSVVLKRYYDRHGKNTRSCRFAKRAVDGMTDFFGEATVAELTPENQRRFVRHMQSNGSSTGYIKRFFTGVLRPALTHAFDNGELERVPPVLKPKEFGQDVERDRILTLDEMAALWDAVAGAETEDLRNRLRMYLVLALNTLARPEAIVQLQRFQVDQGRNLLRLNPTGRQQTKKRRPDLPITSTLYPWLLLGTAANFVHYYGKPIKAESLNKPWRQLRVRAGLDDEVVPYTLRHTMATELARRGVDPWQIQGFLGHRAYGTSERYMKVRPDFLSSAAAAIDAYCSELDAKVTTPLVLNVVPISRQLRASEENG